MEIQLAHSECSTETACPLYVPQLGVEELHKCAEQAAKHSEQIGKLGWYYLMCILFDTDHLTIWISNK